MADQKCSTPRKAPKNRTEIDMNHLRELLKCATIDLGVEGLSDDTMKELTKQMQDRIINEIHDHKIYQAATGRPYWYTYVNDESMPKNRRKIKRSTHEGLMEALLDFYREQSRMDMTMNQLFDQYMIFRRDETSAKAGTIRKDMSLWRTYCKKFELDRKQLGNYKVCQITIKLLYKYFRKLTKDREYTKKTVTNIRSLLSGMLSYAVEQDLILANPVREVDFKRLTFKPIPDKSEDVYTTEDVDKLFAHLRTVMDDPYALAIMLDFNLFVRVGELAGLKWENVDIENRNVYICNQLTYEPTLKDNLTFSDKVMVTEDYLKGCTSQGYRHEYLTDEAIEVLEKARELNPDGEFVFMPFGKPIITTTFNKRLRKYCTAADVPYHSSHKIRFYVASTAYDGKNLLKICKMMGHSNIATTLHYLRDSQQDGNIADVFENLGSRTKV